MLVEGSKTEHVRMHLSGVNFVTESLAPVKHILVHAQADVIKMIWMLRTRKIVLGLLV